VPDFQIRHEQQAIGLEGLGLGDKCRQQILASARNIPLDSIYQVNDSELFVASESYPGHWYLVDLSDSTYDCDCDDFLRIRFCKHIAAVNIYFPELFLEPERTSAPKIPECMPVQDQPQITPESDVDKHVVLLKDLNTLCQQLMTISDDAAPDVKALESVKFSLNAAIHLANGARALPEKDDFNPNQKTWAETAKHMGVQKVPRWKPGPVGGNTTERCIGTTKGKCCKYGDPYAAGERSGKCAKPDAVSAAAAAANDCAHATVPAPPLPCTAALAPACATPSAEGSFTCANRSTVVPLAYPPSSIVLGLAFLPFPAALQGHAFTPLSATVPPFAYARMSAQALFRAEITPRNAHAHAHFTLGPST